MSTLVQPSAPLPVPQRTRELADWIRSQVEDWEPRYELGVQMIARLSESMALDPENLSNADKVFLHRLLNEYGLTPLGDAKLQRIRRDLRTKTVGNTFDRFKE